MKKKMKKKMKKNRIKGFALYQGDNDTYAFFKTKEDAEDARRNWEQEGNPTVQAELILGNEEKENAK
jgi:hypothetical protein